MQYAVFMEKWLMLVLGKKGNEYVHYYMAHIMSIVATVKTVLLLFCVLTFYTIMPLHLNPYSFIEVLLLYFVEYSPRTYIKVVLHRASWRATQIKKDQHKKYHIFGSRRSYIAPKSLFTSLRYIWRRSKFQNDVDSCILMAILIFVHLPFDSNVHTSTGTYEKYLKAIEVLHRLSI